METMLSCLKLVALGVLTVGPSVGWLVILSAKNEVQRIPKGTIVALFVLIALLIWPIATMEHHVNSINPFAKDSFLWQCFRQFLSIAFNEEFGKLVLLLVVTHLSKRVD